MVNDKTPMPVNQRADRPLPKREREREDDGSCVAATDGGPTATFPPMTLHATTAQCRVWRVTC
jgi:hypothetical protein